MKIRLAQLAAVRSQRPPAYIEAIYAAGIIRGTDLHIPGHVLADQQRRHGVTPATAPRGLGDTVATLAAPIARLTGKTNCQACHDHQAYLNEAVPYTRPP
jgi:hypothetical protein